MGITHVLNAAEGNWEGSVELCQEHYAGTGIKYLGLPLWDDIHARILPYLGCANEFIASAFEGGRSGKVLVNCQMGVSRSCAAAMSYMMITLGWKAVDVLKTFRTRRDVRPNDTFMDQLAELVNCFSFLNRYFQSGNCKVKSNSNHYIIKIF
jgi:protein-tyrosine phosphatase